MGRVLKLVLVCVAVTVAFATSPALANVGECIAAAKRGDYETALEVCHVAALKGDSNAQFNLGLIYRKGKGVERDDQEAFKWYRMAAEQCHAKAQSKLGAMYFRGYGVRQNYKKAVEWYRKAAEKGDGIAQSNLGFMFYAGHGVAKNKVRANMWVNLAIMNGNENAKRHKKVVERSMSAKDISKSQELAQKWMQARGK
jgi:TPR repeat protein